MVNQNQPKKPYNKWLSLINIPFQMGVIVFLFVYLGRYLDENYPHQKLYYYKLFAVIGVFVAMFNVYRQVVRINNKK